MIVDVEIFGTMPVSYFQHWDNLSVAYDKRNTLSTKSGKENEKVFFDYIRTYCVLQSSNYRVKIDSSEKQKLF